MAQEEKSLLAKMSGSRNLPEKNKGGVPSTVAPRDPSTPAQSAGDNLPVEPKEIVGAPEGGTASEGPASTPDASSLPKAPVQKWKVKGEELTLDEIARRGLMDSLITQAEQYPYLNKKHQELLEGLAEKVASKPPAASVQAAQPRVSPEQILTHYLPRVRQLAEEGYIESDLVEAYPNLMASLSYFRDIVEMLEVQVQKQAAWIQNRDGLLQAQQVEGMLLSAVDAVAANEGKIFELLKNQEVRSRFIHWIKTQVDPKVGDLVPEKMKNYWLAFNGEYLLEMLKEKERQPQNPKPNIKSDGGSSQIGAPDPVPEKKSMLDRLSESRLGVRQ